MDALTVSVIALWVVVAVLVVCFYSVVRLVREVLVEVRQRGVWVGQGLPLGTPAPDFSERSASGEVVTLKSLAGRHIALLFTSITCKACERLLDEVNEKRAEFAEFAASLVIVNSGPRQPEASWPGWTLQDTFKVLPRSDLFRAYRIWSVPTVMTIGPAGTVERQRPVSTWQELLAELKAFSDASDVVG